jgi:two-component system response regulator HydG
LKALDSVDWNSNEAAKVLGINRTTLYKKMLRYGLLKGHKVNQP